MSPRKRSDSHGEPDEQAIREQEVLRAHRELAAYFRGRRTEREARSALKIKAREAILDAMELGALGSVSFLL